MTFFPKIEPFMTQCEEIWYSWTSHRWQYSLAHDGRVRQSTDDNIIWYMMVESDSPQMTI